MAENPSLPPTTSAGAFAGDAGFHLILSLEIFMIRQGRACPIFQRRATYVSDSFSLNGPVRGLRVRSNPRHA